MSPRSSNAMSWQACDDVIGDAAERSPDSSAPAARLIRHLNDTMAAASTCAVWRDDIDGIAPLFVSDRPAEPRVETVLHDAVLGRRPASAGPVWELSGDDIVMRLDIVTAGGRLAIAALFDCAATHDRAAAGEAIEQWLPVARIAFELWAAQWRAELRVRALTAALNHSDAATILVDSAGRLLFANASAEKMLATCNGLRRNGAVLSGNRLADTLRLQAAIEHVVEDGRPDRDISPVVALPRASGRPLLAAVVAADQPAANDRDSAAILYLFDPDQDIHPLAEPACKLYGLSPTETRLTCLLADGQSLADAAKDMRIREQTARSYLKQVFSKTATNRQAELVRLMLKSLVRTAAGRVTRFV